MEKKGNDERLEKMKQAYEKIEIPNQLRQSAKAGIRQAKAEAREKKKRNFRLYTLRTVGAAAAALLFLTVMVNADAGIAHAMAQIPVLGAIAEVVTFREYKNENSNMEADIKIPEINVKNQDGTVNEDATQKINKSIQEYTDEIIARYEADVEAAKGEGHLDVEVDYTVITDNNRLFSIRFDQLLVMASGTQMVKIYHIDKQTGEMINLSGLFYAGADFASPISESIKAQMRDRMAKDESVSYFLDSEVPEWDFQSVDENTTFYVNENGKLVIVFDEYEVAPGYMGSVEFEIPTEAIQDLAQEGFLQ